MSEMSDFRCPNCGAPLAAQGEARTVQCPFCGTQAVVPLELRAAPSSPPAVNAAPTPLPGWAEALRQAETARGNANGIDTSERVKPRRRSSALGCLVVLALFVGIGMILEYFPGALGASSLVSSIVGTPTPTVQPIEHDLTSDLPRTFRYAGFTFHITQGVIDNQAEKNDQVTHIANKAFARLKVDMENTTQEDLYLDAQLFKLKLADGKSYPLDTDIILNSNFIAPPPGASGSTQLIFDVPVSAQWDGAALVVSEKDSEPADIPLTGAIPNDPYPMKVSLPEGLQATSHGVAYQVLSVAKDINSGAKRAAQGSCFLLLNMRMTNKEAKSGANLSSDYYRLTVNGITQAPVSAPIEVVDYQVSMDKQVVFMIPANASKATLQVGDVRSDPTELGSLELDLSQTVPGNGS